MDQGSCFDSSQTRRPSQNVNELNESVFELQKPQGRTKIQVIFFHGFQLKEDGDAHLSTWRCRNGDCLWPQSWLGDEFPDAHILSISYNARLTKSPNHGNLDLFLTAENLLSDLLQANIGQEPDCPVILVGHSFGGLVIKQLCVLAKNKGNHQHYKFLENLKGLFFYSTPHHGIPFKDWLARFGISSSSSPLLDYVKTLSAPPARLNQEFEHLIKKYDIWEIAGVGESRLTKWPVRPYGVFKQNFKVVPESSSRYGDFRIVPDADHFTICQPVGKLSASFTQLTKLVHDINSKMDECPENLQYLRKNIVGLDHVIEEVKAKLHQATTGRLGLSGMAGIGKTTLAKALFNNLLRSFEYTCFIDIVQTRQESVKSIMMKHLHHWGRPIVQCRQGLGILKEKRLLLVIDNVSSNETDLEIVEILQNDICVHEDSRFVATSRDSEALKNVTNDYVYPMVLLSEQSSDQLFRAFALRNEVRPSCEIYVPTLVKLCEGLPLTLVLIGSHLYKKSERIWKETIEALKKAEEVGGFEEKLWAKLKVSYDGLNKVEQDMFCDAATIFYSRYLNLVTAKAAWSVTTGYQETRWQRIVDLSLAWESEPGYYRMHEQILALGRKIASNPENGRQVCYDHAKAVELLTAEDCTQDDVKLQGIVALNMNERETLSNVLKELSLEIEGAVTTHNDPSEVLNRLSVTIASPPPPEEIDTQPFELPAVKAAFQVVKKMLNISESAHLAAEGVSFAALIDVLTDEIPENRPMEEADFTEVYEELSGERMLIEGASRSTTWNEEASAAAAVESGGTATQIANVESTSTTTANVASTSITTANVASTATTVSDFLERLKLLDREMDTIIRAGAALETRHRSQPENPTAEPPAENLNGVFQVVHLGVTCDQCGRCPIEGPRFKSVELTNYDLCLLCFVEGSHRNHEYVRIDVPLVYGEEWIHGQNPVSPLSQHIIAPMRTASGDNLNDCESSGEFDPWDFLAHWMQPLAQMMMAPDPPWSVVRSEAFEKLSLFYKEQEQLAHGYVINSSLHKMSLSMMKKMVNSLREDPEFRNFAITLMLPSLGQINVKPELSHRLFLDSLAQRSQTYWASIFLKLQDLQLADEGLNIRGSTLSKMKKLLYLDLANTIIEEVHGETFPSTLVCLWLEEMNFTDFILDPSYHKCLAVLSLYNCRRLGSLPETFGQLSSLQVLSIVEVGLTSLPDSFGNLSNLTHLKISSCVDLEELPETFGNLVALRDLRIEDCPCLHQLPDTFLRLQKLEHLGLLRSSLQSIPKLEKLQSLRTLTVDWCAKKGFPILPEYFGEVITRENYNRGQFTFAVASAQFTLRKYEEFGTIELLIQTTQDLWPVGGSCQEYLRCALSLSS